MQTHNLSLKQKNRAQALLLGQVVTSYNFQNDSYDTISKVTIFLVYDNITGSVDWEHFYGWMSGLLVA